MVQYGDNLTNRLAYIVGEQTVLAPVMPDIHVIVLYHHTDNRYVFLNLLSIFGFKLLLDAMPV